VFGHTLVWHEQNPGWFVELSGDRAAFAAAYGRYVEAVAGRWRGRVAGWDVDNEPYSWNGDEDTGGLWARVLGKGWIARAFEHARAADPGAVLFLNDYNLEHFPKKRARFLKLAERLLAQGVPLGGLGTQTHLNLDTDPASLAPAMRELASLGLPIHVSELDVTLDRGAADLRSERQLLDVQARLVGAAAEAFMALPEKQRWAFTTWGVRDRDSWRRKASEAKGRPDRPLLLDDDGAPKPAFRAAVEAWR